MKIFILAEKEGWITDVLEREWIESNDIATQEELDQLEKEGKKQVVAEKKLAWDEYLTQIKEERDEVVGLLEQLIAESANGSFITPMMDGLKGNTEPIRKDIVSTAKKALRIVRTENLASKERYWIGLKKLRS